MPDDRSVEMQNSQTGVINTGDNATIHYHAPPSNPIPILDTPANPQASKLFIGRKDELAQLKTALDKQQPVAVTAVLEGMAGVGKSYLIDHFALTTECNYQILSLNPFSTETQENLIGRLAERLRVTPHIAEVKAHLKATNTLLHLENIDSTEMAQVAMGLVQQLQGCRLVLSGRLHELGRGQQFAQIKLNPFDLNDGIEQLKEELAWLKAPILPDDALKKVVEAVGGLPLAIHLAAGYLATGSYTVTDFLTELHNSQLKLASENYSDMGGRNANHCTLHAAFSVSLQVFARQQPEHVNAICALGCSHAREIGFSLACALLNLSPETAKSVLRQASKLGLLMASVPQPDIQKMRWQLHPLIAEFFRVQLTELQAIEQRLSNWFMQRLPNPDTEEGYQAWLELNSEQAALRTWLERVPLEQGEAIVQTVGLYADLNGPWTNWRQLCEKCLASPRSDAARSDVLWIACRCSARLGDLDLAYQFAERKAQLDQQSGNEREYALARGQIADILQARGELAEALRILQKELIPVFERLGDVRSRAVCFGRIADILYRRGELAEALRIRQEEQMPVYERLGDVRERAVTLGKIADILEARGELAEALRIRQEEEMPVYERLGDVRSRAVTLGKIADILEARGELAEALRIRQEEMPVYERLGDVRSRAVTLGKIADILEARGELAEALRIRQEEQMPVYERLGDVRERAVTLGKIADILQACGELAEALRIRQEEQMPVYERLGDVRSRAVCFGRIADILQARGELAEALRIRQEEEMPVYERLGDVRSRAVTLGKIADILQARGELAEALRILQEELIPVFERLGDVRSRAVTLGYIADILQARGELAEALRIRQEEMPVYERLGDVRSRAVCFGRIADILYRRGELAEALRIRQEEQMPVYERLGDVRSRAVCFGRIADILYRRGELAEALRILQKELIPVFERLGDVRSRAVTLGKIADILEARGELAEALRIRQEEEMPVYERLGDVRERAVCFGKIADILQARGELAEALRIRQEEEMPVYERLGDVRERAVCFGKIADILQARGELAEALRIRQEEMPVYERLGDVRNLLITQAQTAVLFMQLTPPRRAEANQLLCLALQSARKMQIPEAGLIEEWLQHFGMDC
ncbi:tetratricopeptide repeat protein [Beggiatoa leptomitoformis]|uniref:Tetratricopeptide repeat protein n=1 Tax=Beggiatoa leptomitoformis TaxID=288004 RepID=A0A2N9YD99_9GAMM|nr:NB-ARC domain-containing protein [Beggiatoa leptomitoformis]ALG69153.1 hypothetical protein AL038_17500 [Beggiatoa leptomitoformis]AUI68426.1 hypothetical protein BLE401_06720 [Beggiatoa leptomitoformis]